MDQEHHHRRGIGNYVAPPRFLLFIIVMATASWFAFPPFGWRQGLMLGFDAGAAVFLLSCMPLLDYRPKEMRVAACRNDANRFMLLLVTVAVSLAVFVAVATELMHKNAPSATLVLIVGTLMASWTFGNTIFTLHYAHLYYSQDAGGDVGGLAFPETPEPDYWDFVYFAFCLGMTFQTSDVNIPSRDIRKVVTFHCLVAFVFNLGILAFTINVLGG